MSKNVSIEKRGHFYDDDFFRDSWNEWDQAMKEAVERWESHIGDKSRILSNRVQHPDETFDVYRHVRSSNVTSNESQAVSISEEEGDYKIVMDVKDFTPNDICVKVLDSTLTVEGVLQKRDGSTKSSETFVRSFTLPPSVNMSAVSSALSRDGVLTIRAPKFILPTKKGSRASPIRGGETATARLMGGDGRTSRKIVFLNNAAGKPSDHDSGPFNPMGGIGTSTYYTKESAYGPNRVTNTYTVTVPDYEESNRKFKESVEESKKEMEAMMRNHSINSNAEPPALSHPSRNLTVSPANAYTSRDVSRTGNTNTEREERRWDDHPAPGVQRNNRTYSEASQMRDDDGHLVGNKLRREQESKAQGEREETLADGTKCKVYTKSYETKNSYQSSVGGNTFRAY